MPNIQINNLPLYTGNTNGSYLIMNNSGETTTYKTTLENLLLNTTTPQFDEIVNFWNTYVNQPYQVNGNGIIYWILASGAVGNNPKYSNTLNVTYTAKLMNNSTIDSGTGVSFPLSSVVKSWQIILQLIKGGGRILFASPSQYNYGVDGNPPIIPANSPIYFDVTLNSVS